jgi:hypothetical protein
MNLSNFEVVYKTIFPGASKPVLQGYFLSVTNLGNSTLQFALEFTVSNGSNPTANTPPTNPERDLFGRAVGVYDLAGNNNALALSQGGYRGGPSTGYIVRTPTFTVPARQTALVTVLPKLQMGTPPLNIEARGSVELVLPALKSGIFTPFGRFNAQNNGQDVPVLVQAESRSFLLGPSFALDDFTQSPYSLASGASFKVTPRPSYFVPFVVSQGVTTRSAERLVAGSDAQTPVETLPDEADATEMMSILDEMKPAELEALNTALKKGGMKIEIKRSK